MELATEANAAADTALDEPALVASAAASYFCASSFSSELCSLLRVSVVIAIPGSTFPLLTNSSLSSMLILVPSSIASSDYSTTS